MLERHLRQAATLLLDSSIRIAPPRTREWGHAIRGELCYVESSWAATMWALGGAGFMAKQALIAFLVPARRDGVTPGDELFAKNVSLRKVALLAGAACALAALLFFAAPPFRQAFRVALGSWRAVFQTSPANSQPELEALARQAEAERDPEGLAFCAVRLQNSRESARLAKQAVQLDANLLWVYAIAGLRHPEVPEASAWAEKLARWDPDNALPHLLAAESAARARLGQGESSMPGAASAWQDAMAMAFQSPKFDDYLDRVAEINRRVVPRYGFYDPYEVQSREEFDLPEAAFRDFERFAESLFQSGQVLEAQGDLRRAPDQYWTVARFGQVLDSQGRTGFEHWAGTSLQALAYKQLQASAERAGDRSQAALFGYFAAKFAPAGQAHAGVPGESAFGPYVSRRNAAVVGVSGLMILVFSGLLIVATLILAAGSRPSAPPAASRARPVATMVLLTSAAGLLFSTVTLYVTYRPYWYIFQSAVVSGGASHTRDLRDFLTAFQTAPGGSSRLQLFLNSLLYSGSPSFLFYVWVGVTLLGVIGLVAIFLRHFRNLAPACGVQHPPHVR